MQTRASARRATRGGDINARLSSQLTRGASSNVYKRQAVNNFQDDEGKNDELAAQLEFLH